MEGNHFEFHCPNYVDFEKECFSEDDTISDVFFDCSGAQVKFEMPEETSDRAGDEVKMGVPEDTSDRSGAAQAERPKDTSDRSGAAQAERPKDTSDAISKNIGHTFKGPSKMRMSVSVGNLVMFEEESYIGGYNRPEVHHLQERNEDNIRSKTKYSCSNSCDEANKLCKERKFGNFQENEPLKESNTGNIKRVASHGNLNKLAHHKSYCSVDDLKGNTTKFISMAEAINKFQNGTPIRFRSKPSAVQANDKCLTRTIPQSPTLQTKSRSRPILNVLTHEEKEFRQFEELQKCKIKANPINAKVLQGPMKLVHPPEKKSGTIVRPFNLTKVQPKKTEPSPQKFVFHAQPIYIGDEKAGKPQKVVRPNTQAVTPSFMKNYKPAPARVEDEPKNCEQKTSWNNELTKPVPFSFELRDKMVREKRNKLLQKREEEERKAREFVARGVPKYIQNKNRSSAKSESGSSVCSSKRNMFNSQENLSTHFKARPPTVLFKQPFLPAKSEVPLTSVKPFNLESESRAIERLEFKRKLQLKEEQMEFLRQIQEQEMQRQEEEERRRIRQECEQFRAHPVRQFRQVIIQPSRKVTEPISPNFCYKKLQQGENKENVVDNK